jgi:hypothetical protein
VWVWGVQLAATAYLAWVLGLVILGRQVTVLEVVWSIGFFTVLPVAFVLAVLLSWVRRHTRRRSARPNTSN